MGLRVPLQARPIDMGLPSGVQWANCNVGAERPADSGLYFSWGNTEGHAEGDEYSFSRAIYNTTPGAAIASDLSLENDAARANLGLPWRMPTVDEFQELCDNCTTIWTTWHGKAGCLFTSNINGNTLFIPAAGYYSGTSLNRQGEFGLYWASTFYSTTNARIMRLSSADIDLQITSGRENGLCVRAVMNPL